MFTIIAWHQLETEKQHTQEFFQNSQAQWNFISKLKTQKYLSGFDGKPSLNETEERWKKATET
jgi:hypothetical protein